MSTILLSFWSLQFQSRTRYLNACKLKPSGEPNQSEKTSKALKLNERGRSQTHTSLNESADPPWCPHSYVVDAFLQQLHLLFYLCKKKTTQTIILWNHSQFTIYTPPVINSHLHYLDMFRKKLHSFGFTLETSQLPVDDTNKHHSRHVNLKVVTGETRQTSVVCHLLNELDGSESRAADDKQNHRTFFRVLLLNLCPLGSN